MRRLELVAARGRSLTDEERVAVRALIERRGRREPLAYVLGDWDFRHLTLRTDARALVPRPETESVVERCIALLAAIDAPRVVDVGTGSGAIALSLALEVPRARVTATDVSRAALDLARENAAANGLDVTFVESSLLDGLTGPFDLVVSNPPYVDSLAGLQPELRHEPRVALIGDGFHERIAQLAETHALAFEVGDGQAALVADTLRAAGFGEVTITRDLAGVERVVDGARR